MNFFIEKNDQHSKARAGVLETSRSKVKTPIFMPVGTKGTVKTLSSDDVKSLGYDLILANTYHLYLRPGMEVIDEFGGVHPWMNWDRSLLTDSGGFQIFSLADSMKITDEGVTFSSRVDGGKQHSLTPERAIDIQISLGADIIMAFDECASPDKGELYMKEAMERTHAWARRCIDQFEAKQPRDQALFGIIQGGITESLREVSATSIQQLPFAGIAIGGLSVGEGKEDMYRTLKFLETRLDERRPHYLMGVGDPRDIVVAVAYGIDMFDCVLPTRMARTGTALCYDGRVNLRNSEHRLSHEPIEADCDCYACKNFSRSYLRHLVMEKEILGLHLITIHNLFFMNRLMRDIREAIVENRYTSFKDEFLARHRVPSDVL
jgi:queuine tRNA-ribosyltransferase